MPCSYQVLVWKTNFDTVDYTAGMVHCMCNSHLHNMHHMQIHWSLQFLYILNLLLKSRQIGALWIKICSQLYIKVIRLLTSSIFITTVHVVDRQEWFFLALNEFIFFYNSTMQHCKAPAYLSSLLDNLSSHSAPRTAKENGSKTAPCPRSTSHPSTSSTRGRAQDVANVRIQWKNANVLLFSWMQTEHPGTTYSPAQTSSMSVLSSSTHPDPLYWPMTSLHPLLPSPSILATTIPHPSKRWPCRQNWQRPWST